VIPLRDNQPTSTFPIVTIVLIALNVLVYIGQQVLPGLEAALEMIPYRVTHPLDPSNFLLQITSQGDIARRIPPGLYPSPGALRPDQMFIGPGLRPAWLTIFTAMFLHSGLLHIGGNMLYLWIFGNNIEDALGKVRFVIFYFVCGVAAAFAQIATDPNSLIPTLGASGAIAGVLGAYLILYPDARVLSIIPIFYFGFFAEIRAFWVLAFWIALQVFQGLAGIGMERGGGVAYFAHIGGFFAGILIILMLGGKRLVARQQSRVFYPPPSGGGYA
jgi:membrane associated rhomboid family serine protease